MLAGMDSSSDSFVEVNVPVSTSGRDNTRRVHLTPVRIRSTSATGAIIAVHDRLNHIDYVHHAGRLYRTTNAIHVHGNWVVAANRGPFTLDRMDAAVTHVRGHAGEVRISPVLDQDFHMAHRLFSSLRSMQQRHVGFDAVVMGPPPDVPGPEIAAANRIAGKMLAIDGTLYTRSHGPQGTVRHDGGRHPYLEMRNPEIFTDDGPYRSRFPAHIPLWSNVCYEAVRIERDDQLEILHPELLEPEAAFLIETERMGWSVLSRMHEHAPQSLSLGDMTAYIGLRCRLRERLRDLGGRPAPLSRYPHDLDRMDLPPDDRLAELVRPLREAYLRTLNIKSRIDELDRLTWFDVVPASTSETADAPALDDLMVF